MTTNAAERAAALFAETQGNHAGRAAGQRQLDGLGGGTMTDDEIKAWREACETMCGDGHADIIDYNNAAAVEYMKSRESDIRYAVLDQGGVTKAQLHFAREGCDNEFSVELSAAEMRALARILNRVARARETSEGPAS